MTDVTFPRTLRNPPIREALTDFRVANVTGLDAGMLSPLRAQLKERYPKCQEGRRRETSLELKGEAVSAVTKDVGFHGLIFSAPDDKQVAQFRPDGFTLNRLAPYLGGDALVAEALDLWPRYADIVHPEAVIRLALRYINRLDLPFRHGDDLPKFLPAAPNIPESLPQHVTDFLTRVTLQAYDERVTIIVTQKLELPPLSATSVPLILDVDVFKNEALPIEVAALRSEIEVLRRFAKAAFFGHLSEETVKLYE